MKSLRILALVLASGSILNASCSSSSDSSSNADAGPPGGDVIGAADTHCAGVAPATVDPATCHPDTSASAGGAADSGGDTAPGAGGAADCTLTHDADYGATLYNDSGADDDCKYQAAWASTPIHLNEAVTFTLTASTLTPDQTPGTPLVALADGDVPLTRLDVYEPCKPTRRGPAENSMAKITQTAPGVFTVGPIKFDESGRWVVRFHLYEQCVDGETSPHGHIAFFVNVP